MAIRGSSMALDLDFTYILVLALFSVPLILLNTLVFRPFLRLFAERHERLEGALARAEVMIGRAETQARAFGEKIQVATARGLDARNRLRSEAAEAMSRHLEAERAKLRARVEAAVREIETSTATALRKAEHDAKQLAEITASKLLGRGI